MFAITLDIFIRHRNYIIYFDITLIFLILGGAYLIQEIARKNDRKVIATITNSSFIVVMVQILIGIFK